MINSKFEINNFYFFIFQFFFFFIFSKRYLLIVSLEIINNKLIIY